METTWFIRVETVWHGGIDMFDESFLQNMGVLGCIENARLQQKVREQEAEIERLKAKLKDQGVESYYVSAINDVIGFLERAKDRGMLKGNESIIVRDGDDYKLVSSKIRVTSLHEITQGGKKPIKQLNGYWVEDINKEDYLNNVIVLE